jgi:hypothetical protein
MGGLLSRSPSHKGLGSANIRSSLHLHPGRTTRSHAVRPGTVRSANDRGQRHVQKSTVLLSLKNKQYRQE